MRIIHQSYRPSYIRAPLGHLKATRWPQPTSAAAASRKKQGSSLSVGPPVQPSVLDNNVSSLRSKNRLKKLKAKPDPKSLQEKEESVHSLVVLLKAKSWEKAAKLYLALRAKDVAVPHAQESLILKGLCGTGKLSFAWKVYSSLQDGFRVRYSTYHNLVKSAVKAKSYRESLSFFKAMKADGYTPNVITYCTLINGLLHNRRKGTPYIQIAYDVWKELEVSGVSLDAAALRSGCNACVSNGKLQEAMQFIERLRAAGFRADARVYNMLIKGHCRAGDVESGWRLMNSMPGFGVQPDQTSYNILIHAYASLGDMKKATTMLEDARHKGLSPDVYSYTTILNGYTKQHSMKNAQGLFENMKGSEVKPNMVTYGSLIDGYAQGGEFSKALEIVGSMLKEGIKPNTQIFNSLLKRYNHLSDENWSSELEELLKDLKAQNIDVEVDTYNAIMTCALQQRDGNFLLKTLRQMLSTGIQPDAVTWMIVMKGYQLEGQLDSAQMAFNQIEASPDAGMDQVALNANVSHHVKGGDLQAAEAALEEALEFAQSSSLPAPVEAFDALITGYANDQSVQKAISAFRRFYQLGGHPDARICTKLLRLCVEHGEIVSAQKVLRIMNILGLPSSELTDRNWDKKSSSQRDTSEHESFDMERLKFWLGLPNQYYNSSWP